MERDGAVLLDWMYADDVPIRCIRMNFSGTCEVDGIIKVYDKGEVICVKNDPYNQMLYLMIRSALPN